MQHVHSIARHLSTDISADPLAFIAIVLGVVGIWRAEHLFSKLNTKLQGLVSNMRDHLVEEMRTVTISYAAFVRALQAVDLDPMELPKDGAFALLTSFHLTKLQFPALKPDEFAELRKRTRRTVDDEAREYVDLLIKSGIARAKDGVELVR